MNKEKSCFNGNLYNNTSAYYDYDTRSLVKDDLDFYVEYASKTKGEILELASGTGRVSCCLAQKTGRHIKCVEASEHMIEKFKLKLQASSPELQDKIDIQKCSMDNFQFNQKFEYIIIPFRSLQCLPEKAATINCLNLVYSHLADNGLFIFTLFNPMDYNQNWLGKETATYSTITNEGEIIRSVINHYADTNKKYVQYISKYRIIKDGKEKVLKDLITLKYYEYNEIVDMLRSLHFKIKEEYGYYDKSPIKAKKGEGEMIFVCTK
jgi:SAM-dependent methyltransferase